MAEQFFDHDIIHSRFEQPRGKGMAQIMEVEFVHPYRSIVSSHRCLKEFASFHRPKN